MICAKALREEDPKSEAATVLELKYLIRRRQWPKAYALAKKWIETMNPDCTYCYYTLSMAKEGENAADGLSSAKKVSVVERRDGWTLMLDFAFRGCEPTL